MKKDVAYIFETVYKSESEGLFRFCLLRVSDKDQAMDITQETFLRLWQNLHVKRKARNHRAFLFTVAHHLIIDWYRKKKSVSLDTMMGEKEGTPYEAPDEVSHDGSELGAEERYVLDKISELPPTSRDAVYLRFMAGLSPAEIGKILGVSANVVSVRVNRGLQELRKKIGYTG